MGWLLDLCPPEYRTYPTLRRHAVVLARFAVLHVEACQAAVNRGLSEARGGLREVAAAGAGTSEIRVYLGRADDLDAWRSRAGRILGAHGLTAADARLTIADVTDDAWVETWQRESARLIGVRRAAGLVEEALRGRRFVARL